MIRVGIISPSEIAYRRFLPSLEKVNRDFVFHGVAIAEPNEWLGNATELCKEKIEQQLQQEREKANIFIDKYGGIIYDSYQSMVLSEDIDAVYIPLPPALHYKWAKLALENGKHVLLEKPSTTSLKDTDKLLAIASANGLALHENYMFMFHNQLDAINRILESGVIGEIRLYRISFGFPRRPCGDFRYNKQLGGGALFDAGGYTIKYASYLLGKGAKLVTANRNYISNFDVDIYGSATMINEKGDVAQLSLGMDNDYRCELEVWGSQGTFITNRVLTAPDGFIPTYTIKKDQNVETYNLPADDAFLKSIEWFKLCIDNEHIRKDNYEILHQQETLLNEFMCLSEK